VRIRFKNIRYIGDETCELMSTPPLALSEGNSLEDIHSWSPMRMVDIRTEEFAVEGCLVRAHSFMWGSFWRKVCSWFCSSATQRRENGV
jgi:hypothetical protein